MPHAFSWALPAIRYHPRPKKGSSSLPSPLCLLQGLSPNPLPLTLTSASEAWPQRSPGPFCRMDSSMLPAYTVRPVQCFTSGRNALGTCQPTQSLLSPQTHSQDIEKLKSQYRSLARDSAQARRKYQEASKGV